MTFDLEKLIKSLIISSKSIPWVQIMGRSGIKYCSMWRGYKGVFQRILMAAILELC